MNIYKWEFQPCPRHEAGLGRPAPLRGPSRRVGKASDRTPAPAGRRTAARRRRRRRPAPPPGGGGGGGGGPAPPPSGGGGSSVSCAADGSSASYSETLGTASGVATRAVAASGCPNHASLCTGKARVTGCGGVGASGTFSEAADQGVAFVVPASPVLKATHTADDVKCQMGPVAYALNGVAIFSGAVDTSCGALDVADASAEWTSFDCCSGHAEQTGAYHYHFPPSCLLAQLGALGDGHSPQVGWAADGFPIYGPRGPGGVEIRNCGAPGADGAYCQDACGGYEGELAVDDFRYRYYLTGKTSDLDSLPSDPKPDDAALYAPYTIDCHRGCTHDEMSSGACSGTSGVANGYVAAATAGVVDPFPAVCLDGVTDYSDDDDAPAPTPAAPSGEPTPRPRRRGRRRGRLLFPAIRAPLRVVADASPVRGAVAAAVASSDAGAFRRADAAAVASSDAGALRRADASTLADALVSAVQRPDARSLSATHAIAHDYARKAIGGAGVRTYAASQHRADASPVRGAVAAAIARSDAGAVSRADAAAVASSDAGAVSRADASAVARSDAGAVSRADASAVAGAQLSALWRADASTVASSDAGAVSRADAAAVAVADARSRRSERRSRVLADASPVRGADASTVARSDAGAVSRADASTLAGALVSAVQRPDARSLSATHAIAHGHARESVGGAGVRAYAASQHRADDPTVRVADVAAVAPAHDVAVVAAAAGAESTARSEPIFAVAVARTGAGADVAPADLLDDLDAAAFNADAAAKTAFAGAVEATVAETTISDAVAAAVADGRRLANGTACVVAFVATCPRAAALDGLLRDATASGALAAALDAAARDARAERGERRAVVGAGAAARAAAAAAAARRGFKFRVGFGGAAGKRRRRLDDAGGPCAAFDALGAGDAYADVVAAYAEAALGGGALVGVASSCAPLNGSDYEVAVEVEAAGTAIDRTSGEDAGAVAAAVGGAIEPEAFEADLRAVMRARNDSDAPRLRERLGHPRSSRLRVATLLCVVATTSALRPSHVVTRPSRVVDRRDVAPLALAGLAAAALAPGAARGAATKLPSGLVVEDVVVGGGDYPSAASAITMDFAARVGGFDGKPYVTSPATGVRVDLGTDAIAPGLKEAILAGAAARRASAIVPPDATLYYEFKIRSITLSRGIGFGLNCF
ncbi:hypothetical protein JL722_738 [Aureococcus anophagefferens]|nr:hypothetical protein JL722_738 [Aureococcus anophagefferens]